MATANPFDLLGDDDNDDPSQLLAAQQHKLPLPSTKKSAAPAAAQPAKLSGKLPSKPLPPSQAVKEAKSEAPRGGRGGGGRESSRGRGGRGYNRESLGTDNSYEGNNNGFSGGYSRGYSRPEDGGDGDRSTERRGGGYGAPRGRYGGGRRGGYSNGDSGEGDERPRRIYERRSGTGRGNEFKREGAGRGNWGTSIDEIPAEIEETVNEINKTVEGEKQVGQEDVGDANKEAPVTEPEEEPEDKEMTLEEYEKVLEEKRKALVALKTEERKVALDKELQSMQLLSNKKKNDDEIFIKLGSDKEKRKEAAEKEERAKKSLSINEFLKPAEGEKFSGGRGRGRGRGRGSRGGFTESNTTSYAKSAPKIEDVGQFPSLGGK